MDNNFEILGKVVEFLGSKAISEKSTKEDYLVEYGKPDKQGRKNNAVVSVFSFYKNKYQIKNIETGESYKFTLCVDGRQLQSGKWVNNLKVLNIQ